MDKSIDPCVDLYHYSCGEWQKKNPIPPDQTSWSVYGKLYQDNLNFLRGILEQAALGGNRRDAVTRKIGDFYAACLDEAGAEERGLSAVQPDLDGVARLKSTKEMAPLVARLQLMHGGSILFAAGSTQDPDNSEQVIAELDQGGLGLPDRDPYTNDDAKSKETRQRYLQHIQLLTLGEDVADLGGEILAFMAWKDASKGKNLQLVDGLTPEQRFLIGFAQWDCANERPEDLRVRAMTDPHSPAKYRINGVLVNMP